MAEEKLGKEVGKIRHYFDKISVAVVDVSSKMKLGDKILVKGPLTNFRQTIESMQIDKEVIREAKKGQAVGMKMASPVKDNDKIYLLE